MGRPRRPPSTQEQTEMRRRAKRRFERAREPLGAGNMNNAKWREVFKLIRCQDLRIKFVDEEQPRQAKTFACVAEDSWCDSSIGALVYREIEWLEVIGERASFVLAGLADIPNLPVVSIPNGFRLQAYGVVIA